MQRYVLVDGPRGVGDLLGERRSLGSGIPPGSRSFATVAMAAEAGIMCGGGIEVPLPRHGPSVGAGAKPTSRPSSTDSWTP